MDLLKMGADIFVYDDGQGQFGN